MKKGLNIFLVIIALIFLWQICYWSGIFPRIMFPSIGDIGQALIKGIKQDDLLASIIFSLRLIGTGLAIGIFWGFMFSALAILSKHFCMVYEAIIILFDPLPGVALLPLAILWFGTSEMTTVFIIVHSVLWPISRSVIDGFRSTPAIYIEYGLNMGLSKARLITDIYIPASLPSIISGLKVGWARAWRALISAEMIFGVSGAVGGLGWFIYIKRYQMDTAGTFAALVVIMVIGLIVEHVLFASLEKSTIRKWGMIQHE